MIKVPIPEPKVNGTFVVKDKDGKIKGTGEFSNGRPKPSSTK